MRHVSQRAAGAALVVLGVILLVLSGLLFASGSGTEANGPPSTAATGLRPSTSGTSAPITTTSEASTDPTTTISSAPSTTGDGDVDAVSAVSSLIVTLADSIDSGDTASVLALLHPAIVSAFGPELCRSWVEDEIMALEGYRANGDVSGPTTGSIETPSGLIEFEERYSVPVAFGFQGQQFEAIADFVVEGGEAYFTGTCE